MIWLGPSLFLVGGPALFLAGPSVKEALFFNFKEMPTMLVSLISCLGKRNLKESVDINCSEECFSRVATGL